MRDHQLKNRVGEIEDEIVAFTATMRGVRNEAGEQGATAHAAFYDSVIRELLTAQRSVAAAYTLLLQGDGDLIEPLDEEITPQPKGAS